MGGINVDVQFLENRLASFLSDLQNALGFGFQVFTSNGTYIPTSGMLSCLVIATGPGGGGGGADDVSPGRAIGGGGGAGGTVIRRYTSVEIGASQIVVVPAGGVGGDITGSAGTSGSNTLFGAGGTLITAQGGTGGAGAPNGNATVGQGGPGGGALFGDLNIPGGPGYRGDASFQTDSQSKGGAGGNSFWGGGADGAGQTTPFNGVVNGDSASVPGTGGGGGLVVNDNAGAAGGSGASGIIVVLEFVA